MLLLKYIVPPPPNGGTACPATAVLSDHPAALEVRLWASPSSYPDRRSVRRALPACVRRTLVGATTGQGAPCLWRCLTLVSPGLLCRGRCSRKHVPGRATLPTAMVG